MCASRGVPNFPAMTQNRFLVRAAAVLAAGGLAWLAKLAVIASTDGRVTDTGAAAVFYLLGAVLMPAGLAGVALALTTRRHPALRAGAAVVGAMSFFACFVLLDGVASGAVGEAGPAWLGDEAGILATGAVLAGLGLATARRATAHEGRAAG